MCRLLGYLGLPTRLDRILVEPEHSLVVQGYEPQEMTAGVVNADGFGLGWYALDQDPDPFTYKSILPIWNDVNLASLGRYIISPCVLANVRSATPGIAVDLSNCQPFSHGQLLGVHNGFVHNFRQTWYRPLRDRLDDPIYQVIGGTTDSEHLFALLLQTWRTNPSLTLSEALEKTLLLLVELAQHHPTEFSANFILSDGQQLVASRFAHPNRAPSLYWLRNDATLPKAVAIASEPFHSGDWIPCPERTVITVDADLDLKINTF